MHNCLNSFASSKMSITTINQSLSVFIPYVFSNFGKEYVKNVFETHLDLGKVSRVDFVAKIDKQGKEYNAAYVHFSEWSQDANTARFQEEVCTEKGARIIYDDPWFWVILENVQKKHVAGERKARLILSEPEPVIVSKCLVPRPVLLRDADYKQSFSVSDLTEFPALPSKGIFATATPPSQEVPLQKMLAITQPLAEVEWTKEDFEIAHAAFEEEGRDEYEYTEEDFEQMAELEDDTDGHIVSIDGRYVSELERTNAELQEQLMQMNVLLQQWQQAYHSEAAKAHALATRF